MYWWNCQWYLALKIIVNILDDRNRGRHMQGRRQAFPDPHVSTLSVFYTLLNSNSREIISQYSFYNTRVKINKLMYIKLPKSYFANNRATTIFLNTYLFVIYYNYIFFYVQIKTTIMFAKMC